MPSSSLLYNVAAFDPEQDWNLFVNCEPPSWTKPINPQLLIYSATEKNIRRPCFPNHRNSGKRTGTSRNLLQLREDIMLSALFVFFIFQESLAWRARIGHKPCPFVQLTGTTAAWVEELVKPDIVNHPVSVFVGLNFFLLILIMVQTQAYPPVGSETLALGIARLRYHIGNNKNKCQGAPWST